VEAGPAYWFGEGRSIGRQGGVRVDEGNIGLLRPGFADLIDELHLLQPIVGVDKDGAAVAACFTTRRSAHAVEADIKTLERFSFECAG
jgi:hypothetical protein